MNNEERRQLDTGDMIRELRLRGYTVYRRRDTWKLLEKCSCGRRPGCYSSCQGVHKLICTNCGKSVEGRNSEDCWREWNWMRYKEEN